MRTKLGFIVFLSKTCSLIKPFPAPGVCRNRLLYRRSSRGRFFSFYLFLFCSFSHFSLSISLSLVLWFSFSLVRSLALLSSLSIYHSHFTLLIFLLSIRSESRKCLWKTRRPSKYAALFENQLVFAKLVKKKRESLVENWKGGRDIVGKRTWNKAGHEKILRAYSTEILYE